MPDNINASEPNSPVPATNETEKQPADVDKLAEGDHCDSDQHNGGRRRRRRARDRDERRRRIADKVDALAANIDDAIKTLLASVCQQPRWRRAPGLFSRSDIGEIIESGREYRVEQCDTTEDGRTLASVYERQIDGPAGDDWTRWPGVIERSEIADIIEPGFDFRFEDGCQTVSGRVVYVVYARRIERSKREAPGGKAVRR